jgi:hypothetical protein
MEVVVSYPGPRRAPASTSWVSLPLGNEFDAYLGPTDLMDGHSNVRVRNRAKAATANTRIMNSHQVLNGAFV